MTLSVWHIFNTISLESSQLVQHTCLSCKKDYWVYRSESDLDRGIVECCACRYEGEYIESHQTSAMVRFMRVG